MGTLGVIFFFIFSSSFILSAAKNNCSQGLCNLNHPPIIKFPFYVEKDPQSEPCGYPGFGVRYNNLGETILKLPLSGDFFIHEINYLTQEVLLYDPDNCLPKRLLDLDLSLSQFKFGEPTETYTFLNCTSNFGGFIPIKCLSSPSHTVFAVSTSFGTVPILNTCEVIKTAVFPTLVYDYGSYVGSSGLRNSLWLSWHEPDCKGCESQRGFCSFRNSTTLDIGCFDLPSKGESKSSSDRRVLPKGLVLGMGIPSLMLTMMAISCICMKVTASIQSSRSNRISTSATVLPQPAILATGMDRATIQSYPKVVLGESCRLPRPDDGTCSICLAEYCANDTLRCIPECQHFFHANCIDKWLQMNSTCPVCRNSPQKQANVV